jgi:hypothetical protein
LDVDGNKVGVPIKASSIGCKPILDNLEKKFTDNEPLREPSKLRIKNAIDDCLQISLGNMKNLIAVLSQNEKSSCIFSPLSPLVLLNFFQANGRNTSTIIGYLLLPG